MGERGQPTRLLGAKYGAYLTFGALGGGKESAPGQPTLHQLRNMYRLPQLSPDCQASVHPFCLACFTKSLVVDWHAAVSSASACCALG